MLMLAVSCSVKMDPYKGGTGVRANINGCKAVMYGEPTKKYAAYTIDPVYESYSFSTVRLPLTSNEIGKECQLEITVSTRSALIPGRLIGLCMMPDMRCHQLMTPGVTVCSVLALAAAVADAALIGRKGKRHEV